MHLQTMMLGGVAIVVATGGPDGRPALTRGWGPQYDESKATLTLAVTAPAGSPTLANLEWNGAIAVTVSEPLTYRTVQMKGVVEHVEAPSEDTRARARQHLDRFVADVAQLGIAHGADRLFHGDLRSVSFVVEELYEQTPGQNAGRKLK